MRNFIVKYWLQVGFGVLVSVFGVGVKYISDKLKCRTVEQEQIKDGILAILHDRIYSYATEYIARGYITVGELRNLEYMYESYHALGGNGTGTELFERVKKLEIREA